MGVLAVMVLQQVQVLGLIDDGEAGSVAADADVAASAEASGKIRPPDSMFVMVSKLNLKLAGLGDLPPSSARQLMSQVRPLIDSDADRVRGSVLAFELGDSASANAMLASVESSTEDAALAADAAWVRSTYSSDVGEAGPMPEGFAERHGWFADLAATAGRDDSDPDRRGFVVGGLALVLLFAGFALLLLTALLSGVVLLIVGLVQALSRSPRLRPRFVPPSPGGSVYIEAAALFVWGFIAIQVLPAVLAFTPLSGEWKTTAGLGAQWLLLPLAAWPVVRGVPLGVWRAQVGLVAPRGIVREVGAGIVGYLAAFPIWFCVTVVCAVLTVLLQTLMSGGSPEPPENPVVDLFGGVNGLGLFLLVSLIVVWAPLAEETVFRGCLYRHLRSRLVFPIAAGVSAAAFALMHGYPPLMLIPVMTLGLIFAMVREWRGSIVGAIAGHMLHNGVIAALLITMFWIIG
ncbi:MAG: type II CAAX endopeptidase family protein [Planctomycetota bacterium]